MCVRACVGGCGCTSAGRRVLAYPVCHAQAPNCMRVSILSHKRHDFRKNVTERKMRDLVFFFFFSKL